MTALWIASNNEKKRAELHRLLGPLGYELRLLSEAPASIEVEEDAPDFAGNARKKAVAVARQLGGFALADDSGLCVDALGGRPGVHSARYAGPDATDADRIEKLLREIGDGPRTARFVCHLCVAAPSGEVVASIEATCEGTIAESSSGQGGFGYDPVFIAAEHSAPGRVRTFAELTAAEKDAVSHRGKALRALRSLLEQHPLPSDS